METVPRYGSWQNNPLQFQPGCLYTLEFINDTLKLNGFKYYNIVRDRWMTEHGAFFEKY